MKPFWFGCLAGAAPSVAIGDNFVAGEEVPGFVGIFVSLFAFFDSFALNQWLQYRHVGPWRSHMVGGQTYLVLSPVAKSALAASGEVELPGHAEAVDDPPVATTQGCFLTTMNFHTTMRLTVAQRLVCGVV